VVSVTKTGDILLDDARTALMHKAVQAIAGKDVASAAILWLLPGLNAHSDMESMADYAAECKGQLRSYKQVAILGFAAGLTASIFKHQAVLESGLQWMSKVAPVSAGAIMGFATDPVALLGIAIGTQYASKEIQEAVREWMTRFLPDAYNASGTDAWQKCLLAIVHRIMEQVPILPLPSDAEGAAVRIAMQSRGLLHFTPSNDEEQVLWLLKAGVEPESNPFQAAMQIAALDWIRRNVPTVTPDRVTPGDVVTLLGRLEFALKRWTWEDKAKTPTGTARKWNIDNEYHFQNLLWTILAPIFPDLRDEEYTPQLGFKNPRIDIGIPSLKLIIEAKYMRASDAPKKMIDEIAADASLHLVSGSKYTQIVAVIWDDSARTNLHDDMVRAIKQINGVLDAIIVSRPGNWT
jgi:hypothetical protein